MSIPSAVAEQANQVNQYYEELSDDNKGIDEGLDKQTDEGGDPKPSQDIEPKQKDASVDSEATYEKRFKNFKAHADKTIHEQRLALQKLDDIEKENQALRKSLSHMQTTVETTKPKFSKEALNSFSEEELKIFNDMVARQTISLKDEVSYLRSKLTEQEKKELISQKQQEHLSLKQQVASAVPDFVNIDTSPEFKQWLNEFDAYGTLRMEALRKAQASKDIARIISFYNDFKQVQEPIKVDPREFQQTPSSNSRRSHGTKRSTKVWDNSNIQEFYRDSALGKFSPERHKEVEQEIQQYLTGG